jgi:GNAT superfamily N-acetyltransferase
MLSATHSATGRSVRRATAADAPLLARLCEAHSAYEKLPFNPQGHAERLAEALSADRLHVWLALVDGEVVGYASVTLDYSTLTAQPFLHLDCLYLDEHARGMGLGAVLFSRVKSLGQELGCANVQWQTPEWNAPGIRFYDRTGASRLEKHRYTLALS